MGNVLNRQLCKERLEAERRTRRKGIDKNSISRKNSSEGTDERNQNGKKSERQGIRTTRNQDGRRRMEKMMRAENREGISRMGEGKNGETLLQAAQGQKKEPQKKAALKQNAGRKKQAEDLAYIGIMAALMAVCSWISIPTAVPFTLQTFAVFLAAGVLGGKKCTVSILVYILMGAVGMPVFAGFTGGIGVIFGLTGGYILGFLFTALIMWGAETIFGKSSAVFWISSVLGLAGCYLFGTLWYLFMYTRTSGLVGLATVLGWCVFPFILPDLLKIAMAAVISRRLLRAVRAIRA